MRNSEFHFHLLQSQMESFLKQSFAGKDSWTARELFDEAEINAGEMMVKFFFPPGD